MATIKNYATTKNGKVSAICQFCGKHSIPTIQVCANGEPSPFGLGAGWSMAPFPEDCIHKNGSRGSLYTCPWCNDRGMQ